MQIRLIIGDADVRYLSNLVSFLEKNYMSKLEIFSFSNRDVMMEYFQNGNADVILLDESIGITAQEVSTYGKTALLSDQGAQAGQEGVRIIEKYKKPDLIYKDILDIYADCGRGHGFRPTDVAAGKMILVTGFSGGMGASTFAAALAMKYASKDKKVLYLNLETTGSSSDFFSGTGNYCFDDVIFALKSQRADIRLKMESSVRRDAKSGVYYFEPCSTPMYMLEMTYQDILRILEVLALSGDYEYVVTDMNFQLSKDFMEIMKLMNRIVLVEDGTETANSKFVRTMQALKVLESQCRFNVTDLMAVVYNGFGTKSSSEIPGLRLPVLGKLPVIRRALVHEIINYILGIEDVFAKLL
ncbi:hypothetical protein GPL15_07850 [Clostridium sp. MCC353]|uniref:hypothetical protein n=1 Tax=Clostridium sp. MCC353 TaxID=2592646 RepID=UPI001C0289EC|nr:hypothetical protein [Clostridium sp. MCC353]MBT9776415.1 hypothetical protein [Clostridium sp. MCC353]